MSKDRSRPGSGRQIAGHRSDRAGRRGCSDSASDTDDAEPARRSFSHATITPAECPLPAWSKEKERGATHRRRAAVGLLILVGVSCPRSGKDCRGGTVIERIRASHVPEYEPAPRPASPPGRLLEAFCRHGAGRRLRITAGDGGLRARGPPRETTGPGHAPAHRDRRAVAGDPRDQPPARGGDRRWGERALVWQVAVQRWR